MRILLIIPAALLLHACGTPASGKSTAKTDNDTIPVQVMTLEGSGDPSAGIAVSGQFTTDDETQLSFKTGGVIHALLVKEGDRIHRGQLLATLDLTEINTQVQQAQLNLDKAKRDYQRIQNLYKDSVATLEQLQNAQTALDVAGQQVNAVRFNQNYSEIRAGEDGFVLRKLANPGQVVSPGTPVLETNGAGSKGWLLRVGLSDRQWAQIRLGDKARLETGALPGQTLSGTVSRKSEGVDPQTGTFSADIRVDAGGTHAAGVLAAGLFGKGVIQPIARSAANGTWAIPYQALLDGDGSSGYVFVTDDGHTAHKVRVRLSGMEKDRVIISDGLQNAHALIVSGSAYLTDSSPIRITSPNPAL
ncbi:efflux RND transporter periplasmic adaptor subunit [Dinghuibacter silviterrae]|uniref:RND family efflux transporter MFP subunit n=1 Tax=Dinghuibacter silviterrae TaxID=1539049 RepID=A0A4V3GKL4_9BACT|nr:efflux RND transporter periplasmic adaptor subunit [Dinghuibacter silviterrae]TDW96112.1 RND family efflux transporter MFP subunit [Dinghuibacter silviterrae]